MVDVGYRSVVHPLFRLGVFRLVICMWSVAKHLGVFIVADPIVQGGASLVLCLLLGFRGDCYVCGGHFIGTVDEGAFRARSK